MDLFLHNIKKIRDVFAVELLDGAWQQAEKTPSINSTDDTVQIIEKWKSTNFVPFDINYTPAIETWRSESEKRNWLLKETERKYGRCWVLVLDADEFLKFPSGLVSIPMLPELERHDNCGILNGFAYQSALATIFTVRFIPIGRGFHYHTELAMIIHNNKCEVVCDYNPGREKTNNETWVCSQVILVNNWTLRDNERQCKKYYYQKYQEHQDREIKCRWTP